MTENVMVIVILVFMVIFVSCEKSDDIYKEVISSDSIYFSCTINNEFLEFKSPSAQLLSLGKRVSGFGESKKYSKDTVIIEHKREFYDDNYYVELRFNDSFIIDTTSSFFDVPDMKEYLFEKGNYPFQFRSTDEYDIHESFHWYRGVYVSIYDRYTRKQYESSIDWLYQGDLIEYDDFMEKSEFQITNSVQLSSESTPNSLRGIDISNLWFIEANFKCKLYDRDYKHEENYLENVIYITDGVLKVCF